MSAPNRPFQPRANASGALSPPLSSSGAVSPTPNDEGVFDGAAAASAEAAAAAAAPKPPQQQRTETVTIAPYSSPTSSGVHAVPLSMAMNSSSRVPSASNYSSTLLQQQSSPTMRHQSSPTSGLAGQSGANADRTPLLSQFNLTDSAADDAHSMAADLKTHPIASPAASSSGSASAAAASTSVYDQYESTVAKIRARRVAEAKTKATVSRPTPERQKYEAKVVSVFLSFVTLVVALVVYFMYPRIPLWSIDAVRIEQLKLWSDGSASFQIHTDVSVQNANFMKTGIESISIGVGHNGTMLGAGPTVMDGPLKFQARQNNPLSMDHNFSPVSAGQFRDLFSELSSTAGELTLDYSIAIVTSENFRLRNIQVECQCKMQVDPTPVPPVAQILVTQCSHTEKTG